MREILAFWKVHILIIYRILKQLGFASAFLIMFLFIWGYVMIHLSIGWTIGTYAFVIIGYHFNRGDINLLHALYGQRYKYLLFCQYLVIAIPFIGIIVLHKCYGDILLFFIIGLLAFLPNKMTYPIISHPFLTKGCYEIVGGFRKTYIVYFSLMIIALIGGIVNNQNLIIACIIMLNIINVDFFNMPFRREFFLCYYSVRHFFRLKIYLLLRNYIILQIPFITLYWLSSSDTTHCLLLYLIGCILIVQSLCLRILFGTNIFLQVCLECILIIGSIITSLYMIFIVAEIMTTLILWVLSYIKIKNIIQ